MKTDAVLDIPDGRPFEMAILPGQQVTVHPGWVVQNTAKTGGPPLWLHFVSETDPDTGDSRVWCWDAGGGKESVYGEMTRDEGHPYMHSETERRQDGFERGSLRIVRATYNRGDQE